jgi:hypothetical protein
MTERMTKTLLSIALLALMAFQLVAAYPGYLSHDSAYQWLQARVGEITSLWPPGSVYLLRLFDAIWIGPHLMFIAQIVGYWGCAIAFTWLVRGRALACASAAFFVLMPIAWICIAHVWSDVQLCVLLFAAVVSILYADRAMSVAQRRALLFIAFACLLYSSIIRHNAIVAIAPIALWWCVIAVPVAQGVPLPRAKIALACVAFIAATLVFYVANVRLASTIRADTYAITMIWDVQAISVASESNLMPKEISPDTTIEDLRASFDPVHALQLYAKTKANWANSAIGLSPEQKQALQAAWFGAVLSHPGEYLWHRARVSYRMLGRKFDAALQGGSDERQRLQLRDNPSYALANPTWLIHWQRWSDLLKASRWATPLVWMLIASLIVFVRAVVLFREARRAGLRASVVWYRLLPAICVGSSAVLYLTTFFFTTPAADLRYAMWSTVALVTAALIAFNPPMTSRSA